MDSWPKFIRKYQIVIFILLRWMKEKVNPKKMKEKMQNIESTDILFKHHELFGVKQICYSGKEVKYNV